MEPTKSDEDATTLAAKSKQANKAPKESKAEEPGEATATVAESIFEEKPTATKQLIFSKKTPDESVARNDLLQNAYMSFVLGGPEPKIVEPSATVGLGL